MTQNNTQLTGMVTIYTNTGSAPGPEIGANQEDLGIHDRGGVQDEPCT